MNLTLSEIMSLVTTLNQGRTDYSTSQLSLYVNMALSELCERVHMQSLESTVVSSTTSSTATLALPANINYPVYVSNLSITPGSVGRTLDPCPLSAIDSGSTQLGIPRKFAVYRDEILLWPSADSAYSIQIRFQEKVPTLTSSSSTAAIDVRWHEAIAFRASAIAAAMRNDLEGEAVHQARYLSFVGSTPEDRAVKQRGQPMQFQPVWRRN